MSVLARPRTTGPRPTLATSRRHRRSGRPRRRRPRAGSPAPPRAAGHGRRSPRPSRSPRSPAPARRPSRVGGARPAARRSSRRSAWPWPAATRLLGRSTSRRAAIGYWVAVGAAAAASLAVRLRPRRPLRALPGPGGRRARRGARLPARHPGGHRRRPARSATSAPDAGPHRRPRRRRPLVRAAARPPRADALARRRPAVRRLRRRCRPSSSTGRARSCPWPPATPSPTC